MIFYFNPQDVLTAIYNILVADATLPGANYLTSAGRIFTTRAPEVQTCPYLLITLDMLVPDDMQQYQGEARVFCYTKILANGQIDQTGNRILSKCDELLNNSIPSIGGATVQSLISLGIIPTLYDPEDKSKARGICRYRVQCGKG